MRAIGLDHVSVTVRDLARSLAFYHELLGLPMLGTGEERGGAAAKVTGLRGAHFRFADLDLGSGQILELLEYLAPLGTARGHSVNDPGSGHVGIRVDDLASLIERLNQAGFVALSSPVELEGPPWWEGAKCVYVSDPDGVVVELVQRPRAP